MKKEKWEFSNKWLIFYFDRNFEISFQICGYFKNRPRINIGLFIFKLILILPFENKWKDECDPPKWGIAYHHEALWFYFGGKGNFGGNKMWSWNIPFITKEWVRTSILLNDDTWEHETKNNRKEFYRLEWKEKQKSWNYNYTDKLDGEIIPATIYVEEREWRPKWLKWTKLFNSINRTLDIHFSKECGKGKGSWKGGTVGCGYTILPNETPLDCLRRMETEKIF